MSGKVERRELEFSSLRAYPKTFGVKSNPTRERGNSWGRPSLTLRVLMFWDRL